MKQKQKQINAGPVRHAVYSNIIRKKNRSKLALLNRLVLLLIIVSGVYSVACINDLAIKGFVLRELKIELGDLNRMNEANELAIMELESYENINRKARELKMVKADEIVYITTAGDSFAKK